ncbi:MAG TPA: 2Fe-2S iron-sulfur cluster-binding protein [Steroidobacteraceae bacterium]|nr:2Fe-2S iron-sulfur cluster-binding protein [Steroidobacteraceae bacterium]
MSAFRLSAPAGLWIERARPVAFTFNGRRLTGCRGDTLASALLANGVRIVGRSFKLHRPRGIWSCGLEEPSSLVDVGAGGRYTPNVRATMLPLTEGLSARSVNCWPSAGFDVGALIGAVAPLLPAGFYYKTFKWPSWRWFEPAIRRMAGMGRAPTAPDGDTYEEIAASADVLVVGGGIAGLAAALAAARAGAATMLVACGARLGGGLAWRDDPEVRGLAAAALAAGVRILARAVAFGIYDHNLVAACETVRCDGPPDPAPRLRERLWKVRARAVIAATGAFERPLVFPHNDRPGVMLAGAAEKYARAFGVACGRRAVIAAACDHAYAIAAGLKASGVEIAALIDAREASPVSEAAARDLRVVTGARIESVSGARGVRGCEIEQGAGRPRLSLDCDLLLNAGGYAPAVHLHSQAGGKLRWLEEASMFVPDGAACGVVSVGSCAGVFARAAAAGHAAEVGEALARGRAAPPAPVGGVGRCGPGWGPVQGARAARRRGKCFVDLQNDVSADDVALAARENYRSVEHLKRYTTAGMGTDQGKTSNLNALVLLGEHTGRSAPEVGATRFRPPFAPVTLGAIVGRRVGSLYRPLKRLPAEAWHVAHGALLENFGDWCRPAAYPRPGEALAAAAQREARTVRTSAGLLDGSPLGKLEVFGPGAARFLDLMYVGTMSTLAPGQARYGVLLNENGTLVDDGIVARLAPEHFWVNTTSAGAERTAAAFEEWLQCELTDLEVLVTPVTSRWANVTVAGPRAWDWLARAGFDAALAPAAMKHMTLRESALGGLPLRVLRASFSGELGYEVNLPAGEAAMLLERLWAHADAVGGVLYGVEALQVMRVEKGFIHIGTDTDGTTLPADVGLARGIERKSANFVGRRSLARPAARDPDRQQLVGLTPVDGRTVLPVGAQIAARPPPAATEGRITSSFMSPELGYPVALGLLARGAQRLGEELRLYHLGREIAARVVRVPFVDPQGARVHG